MPIIDNSYKFTFKPKGLEFDPSASPRDWLIAGLTSVNNYENAPLAVCDSIRFLLDHWIEWCLTDATRLELEGIFRGEVDPHAPPTLSAIAELILIPVNTLYNWRSIIDKFPAAMREEFDPLYITHGFYQAVTDYRGLSFDEMTAVLHEAQTGLRDNGGYYMGEGEPERVSIESVRRRCIAIQKEAKERGEIPAKGDKSAMPRLTSLSVYPTKTINIYLTRAEAHDPGEVYRVMEQALSFLEDDKAKDAAGVTLSVKAYIAMNPQVEG